MDTINVCYFRSICTQVLVNDSEDVGQGHKQSHETELVMNIIPDNMEKILLLNRRGNSAVTLSLRWRHNGHDGVSNHQPRECLLNRFSGADQRKHQSSASLAFVRGIHRWPVNSPHKGPVTRKMFPFDDVIMLRLVLSTSSQCDYISVSVYVYRADKDKCVVRSIPAWHYRGITSNKANIFILINPGYFCRQRVKTWWSQCRSAAIQHPA